MWTYYPELLATPVPRYTSYPTAAEFHDGLGAAEQAEGLAKVGADEPISLYLHIPYCREICWYCGCNTGAANRSHRLANYLERLGQEIDLVAGHLGGRGKVARISFGGGSPNAVSPEQFHALADKVRAAFTIEDDATWSVELDPRGFDEPFADALATIGFQRASLGVQTFDDATQRAIGRVQPTESIERSVKLLRRAGVTSLNFDLMYGLPGQTHDVLSDSLARSVDMGADRLAVFGYAHVPHLLLRQRRIDAQMLPDDEERFRQADLAHAYLVDKGMVPVGFDHFARPDDPLAVARSEGRVRRNFQGFTDDSSDILIGLGASAISRFVDALVQNDHNSGRYGLQVGNGRLAGARGIATPPAEQRRGQAIEQWLCQGEADLAGLPDIGEVRAALSRYSELGLVDWLGTRLRLKSDGSPYARAVAATLDPWRTRSKARFSSAV